MKSINFYNKKPPKIGALRAFSLIEILVVIGIVGMIVFPFFNMFFFAHKGTIDNAENVIAYNLARDKIEELKALPFYLIKSDFDNFRDVFRDREGFTEAYYKEEKFEEVFTDVFTEASLNIKENKATFDNLEKLYPEAFLKELNLYSNDSTGFMRVVKIEPIIHSVTSVKAKKIFVKVRCPDGKTTAELFTIVGEGR